MIARCVTAFACLSALALVSLSGAQPASAGEFDSFHEELFFAVLEGLYRDGVDSALVDRVIEVDLESSYPKNFVQGCPICMPALDAFRLYRARPRFLSSKVGSDTFGPGLASAERGQLLGADPSQRRATIQTLIERWVTERMDRLRLDQAERARWRQALEERRKQGMATLEGLRDSGAAAYRDMKACPLCDGATGACKPR